MGVGCLLYRLLGKRGIFDEVIFVSFVFVGSGGLDSGNGLNNGL